MDKIVLLDTAVGSTNKGDEIIMECVKEELDYVLRKYFVMDTPTHLSAFTAFQNLFKLPDSAREISEAKYKFVGGTNLFDTDMMHRCCQWNIDYFNCKPIIGSVFVGVGSKGKKEFNFYTKRLYKKILAKEFVHSVREERAKELLISMGYKAINTGCVTLWKLSEEFCEDIPKNKKNSVIFTLTDYKRDVEKDTQLIQILRKNYKKIYFWIQGIHDLDYLKSITSTQDIEIIPPTVKDYKNVLEQIDADYVGTRLHAGIYAMRHKKRAIILAVDERMTSMKNSIKNNLVNRSEIDKLDGIINSSLVTKVNIDFELINKWKDQFK